MANSKAISPQEVVKNREESIPDTVFEVFNSLITEKFDGYSAIIHQNVVVKRLVESGFNEREIYNRHWLDVEDIYRKKGWEVKYDKPGYCEDYSAYFKFSKPKK
ncbi:MAG: hypothetical protein UV60_C0006G0041 [Parcubacteria group bacterium GW2011_GWA2_43_11]|nr:MAG: hypothetical protein UU89_C0005G0004 [Parcubacteria group bacterium GW2011_GWC2_42_11]KKS85689.1 MAG: hypothetical protein UV60_C0006G0041 [Parcubacteria group bacterium GW2011_GWA2_43_11]